MNTKDETGIPATENEGQEGVVDPVVEEPREEAPKEDEEKSRLEAENKSLLAQLKEQREKRREAEELLKLADTSKSKDAPEEEDDVDKKIRKVLNEERAGRLTQYKLEAKRLFREKFKEFHPDNDSTGVRNELLEETLKRLDTSSSATVADMLRDYEDAYVLLNRTGKPATAGIDTTTHASTAAPSASPKTASTQKLTSKQEEIRKERGWTVEKYLTMKTKYPHIIP